MDYTYITAPEIGQWTIGEQPDNTMYSGHCMHAVTLLGLPLTVKFITNDPIITI